MRLIDADALADEAMDRYCKDCDKRKGIKNGKYRIIYEIGEAPCRGCGVDDMLCELEDAPTVEMVRCKDCKYYEETDSKIGTCLLTISGARVDGFCAWGEGREDVQITDNN